MRLWFFSACIAFVASGATVLGCSSNGPGASSAAVDSGPATTMKTSAPSSTTQEVLGETAGYKSWPNFPENTALKPSQGHGGAWVIAYHNDVVTQAMAGGTLPLADGALIVKENYMHQTDPAPAALTIMAKRSGAWYWIEATPGGQVIDDPQSGAPYEGPSVPLCVGCHESRQSNDWIFTHWFGPDSGVSDAAASD